MRHREGQLTYVVAVFANSGASAEDALGEDAVVDLEVALQEAATEWLGTHLTEDAPVLEAYAEVN